jgi:hypothetical protein
MQLTRRQCLGFAAATIAAPYVRAADTTLGSGDYRYRVVPNWGVLDDKTPVKNCHGMVCTKDQHLVLLTDHPQNNVIVYDQAGRLVHKWGTQFPGAHGLSLVVEDGKELLFITDNRKAFVAKTTLDGKILQEWRLQPDLKQYPKGRGYRPAWTLHADDGSFVVLDGYGKDYFHVYGADGTFQRIFGGPEDGIKHWGPHGGLWENHDDQPTLLLAMSDQQYLLRVGMNGKHLGKTPMPGGNPRQLRPFGDGYVMAHLADNWPKNRNSRGFISILDNNLRVVANLAGSAPSYDDSGQIQKMHSVGETFMHPHDVVTDKDGSIYVAQFNSGNTYPIKLDRV